MATTKVCMIDTHGKSVVLDAAYIQLLKDPAGRWLVNAIGEIDQGIICPLEELHVLTIGGVKIEVERGPG